MESTCLPCVLCIPVCLALGELAPEAGLAVHCFQCPTAEVSSTPCSILAFHSLIVSLVTFCETSWFTMLKLLRRKSFRKSKEFKPSSRQSNLNSSSGSVVSGAGGHYFARPHRRSRTSINPNPEASQNSLDRKSIGSHRYSSVNLGSPVPAPEIIQYSRPPENLTSPVRESNLDERSPARPASSSGFKPRLTKMMNVVTSSVPQEETAARLRNASVMPTPRCLPPTPTRGHRSHMRGQGGSLPPTAQALPMMTPNVVSSPPTSDVVVPKPSARMSLRNKVNIFEHVSS